MFCIISPWMPNGNIVEYTQKNRSINRLLLVSAEGTYVGIKCLIMFLTACAICLWSRISAFTEYRSQRYQPGERGVNSAVEFHECLLRLGEHPDN